MSNIIILELGDIIEIKIESPSTPTPTLSPTTTTTTKKTTKMETVLITYLDEQRLGLTNLDTGQQTTLPLADNRIVTQYGKHVTELHLLSRNPLKGYALQNGLTPGKHICATFAGIPEKLEGEILETKNDMVTILMNDTFEILYLNFGFQGLPKNEHFEVTFIRVIPPNEQQEKRKETLIQAIYTYLENHPSFQESGTHTISINELAAKILQDVGFTSQMSQKNEGLDETMVPWIRRVVRNYIEMVNRQERENNPQEPGEDNREKKEEGKEEVGEHEKKQEPIIGISSHIEMRLLENIHLADQLLRNEGILEVEEKEKGKEGKEKKGRKARKHKREKHVEEEEDAMGRKEAEENLVVHLDVPNQPFQPSSMRKYLLVEQIQAIAENYYTKLKNQNKERTLADIDKLQHLLQRYSQLYRAHIAYPPAQHPLYNHLKHFDQSIGWVMPVVSQSIVLEDKQHEGETFLDQLQETERQFQDPRNHDPHRYHTYLSRLDKEYENIYDKPTSGCVVHANVHTTLPVLATLSDTANPTDDSPFSLTTYLESEPLCLLSILTFPTSVMRYSRVYTPLTSLYETTSMLEGTHGLSMFQMLTPNKNVSPNLVKNQTEKKQHGKMGKGGGGGRFSHRRKTRKRATSVIHTVYVGEEQSIDKTKINNYTLLEGAPKDFDTLLQGMLSQEVNIGGYLSAIPPQARGVGFSIYQLTRQLEPFQIYYDRLTVNQGKLLGQVLVQRTKEYRKELQKNKEAFASLATCKKAIGARTPPRANYLQELAPTDANFGAFLNRVYEEPTHFAGMLSTLSPEELISYMTLVDGGNFFHFCLSASKLDRNLVRKREVPYAYPAHLHGEPTTELLTRYVPPIPANPSLNPQVTIYEPEVPSAGGAGSEVSDVPVPLPPHVSKVTVLPLGPTGKEYCKNLEVVKIYIDREDLTGDNDRTVMSTLLPGVREVVTGDHAILLQGGPESVSYYVRENNHWREDVTIQSQWLYDTPAMFCNMKLNCMRDFTNQKCVSMKALSKYLVQNTLSEGNKQVSYQFLEYLQKNELKEIERSCAISSLYTRSRLLHDHQHFQLGLTRRTFPVVYSPYQDLFCLILAERNFDKRQHQILNFCVTYTRPNDPHNNLELDCWRYCVAKGVPLVPTSLYSIATLYLRTLANFPKFFQGMEQIKAACGTLSEDHASIVDKFTGFKIADHPLAKIKYFCDRRATLGRWTEKQVGKEDLHQDARIIHTIVEKVSQKLGIDLTKDEPFILSHVLNKIPPAIDETDREEVRMYLTLGMMVIAIQTSIPDVVSVKTVPHCKAVLLGYPLLDNPQEMGTITYVACAANKATKRKHPMWKVFARNLDRNESLIKYAIDTELKQLTEVQFRIKNKKEYLESRKGEKISTEHSLREWTTYLPAQLTMLPHSLKVVSSLHQTDRDAIMNVPTSKGLDLFLSKIDEYSLGIEAEIQEIVKKETPPLKFDSSTPNVEMTVCCQDTVTNAVMTYFTHQKNILATYLQGAADLTDRLYHLIRANKARPMISGINTKREYPQPDTAISETTRYAAFVYQAKQDILQGVRTTVEETPASGASLEHSSSGTGGGSGSGKGKKHLVKVFDTLEENIQRLKDNNVNYTEVQFEDLLKNRFKQGILSKEEIYPDPVKVEVKHLIHTAIADIVAELDVHTPKEEREDEEEEEDGEVAGQQKARMLSPTFVTHLLSAMNHKPKGLATYLSHANEAFMKNMKRSWIPWKSSEEIERLVSFLGKALNPNTFLSFDMFLDRMQEFIENITQVYPSMIVSKNKMNVEKIKVPTSWNISSNQASHLSKVMLEKYLILRPLCGNAGVEQIVRKMKQRSRPLVSLARKIRRYYDLQQQQQQAMAQPSQPVLLHVDAMNLLFKYFVYTIYDQYLLLSEGEVDVTVVDRMMELFFKLFVEDKELLNQRPNPLVTVRLRRKQHLQQHQRRYWSSLSKEEREVNKVLHRIKLGPFSQEENNKATTDLEEDVFYYTEEEEQDDLQPDEDPMCQEFEEDESDFAEDEDEEEETAEEEEEEGDSSEEEEDDDDDDE